MKGNRLTTLVFLIIGLWMGFPPVFLPCIPSTRLIHASHDDPSNHLMHSVRSYKLMPGAEHSNFELSVERAVRHVKEKILDDWVSEKDREVEFLERKASVASAVTSLQEVVTKKHGQLKACYDYLQGTPTYNDVIRDVDSFAAMTHSLAMMIITRVTVSKKTDSQKVKFCL